MQQLIKTETFLGIDNLINDVYYIYVIIFFAKLNTEYLQLEDADCECMM